MYVRTGSATPHGLINDPRVKSAYALYLSKFLTAYEDKGIDSLNVSSFNTLKNVLSLVLYYIIKFFLF